MFSSTSENNGFAAIGQNELEAVNGGVFPWIIVAVIGGIFFGGCAMPTNDERLNENAHFGGNGKR